MKKILHLIKKRIESFARLPLVIRKIIAVNQRIRCGARVFIHPIVVVKIILRLFSAPFFQLDSICLPGERRFEKKLNKLISANMAKDLIDQRKYFDFNDFKVFVPNFSNAESIILNDFRELYLDSVYSKHFFMGSPVSDKDVILDVGANIGGFSLWACAQATNVKCFAIEPHPQIGKELQANIALNGKDGEIIHVEKCISSDEKEVRMNFDEEIFTMTRISDSEDGIEVEAISIDALADELCLEKISMLKFDIEGAERFALDGAKHTLRKHKPKIALSGYHLLDDAFFLVDQILSIEPNYNIIVGSNMHIYAFCDFDNI